MGDVDPEAKIRRKKKIGSGFPTLKKLLPHKTETPYCEECALYVSENECNDELKARLRP